MASQGADPPAPQSQVVTVAAPNQTARVGAYTDTSLTKRSVVSVAATSDLPPASSLTTLGSTRPVYASNKDTEIQSNEAETANAAVTPPPAAPNSWARGTVNGRRVSRDPYANGGMVSQNFFNNQS